MIAWIITLIVLFIGAILSAALAKYGIEFGKKKSDFIFTVILVILCFMFCCALIKVNETVKREYKEGRLKYEWED